MAVKEIGYSYKEYLEKNPLYLHNKAEDFKATLNEIPQVNYHSYMDRYIRYLRNEEKKIIDALGGGVKGKDALKVFADEVFNSNQNIKKTSNFLDELFGRTGAGTITTRQDRKFNGDIEEIDLIASGGNRWWDDAQKIKVKYQQNMFLRIPGARFHLIAKERRNRHGSIRNVYDFGESLKRASEEEKQEFSQALTEYINGLKLAFKKYSNILDNLENFINLDALKTKEGSDNTSKTLKNYVEMMNSFDGTITEQWLEFLVGVEGSFYALNGKFNEASALDFSARVIEKFGKGFTSMRGDTATEKNKKPDNIYYGGKLNLELNPITVSMKKIKGSEKFIKAQTSSLMSPKGNEEDGIINMMAKESQLISNILLYLSLNSAFFPSTTAAGIINKIYKYLGYIFLSGSSKDERKDQAIFFVLTQTSGKDVNVKFLSMADILTNIFNSSAIKPVEFTAKLSGNLNSLEQLEKIKQSIYKKRQDEINRGIEWGYNFLYNNEEIKNCILNIAGTDVLYKTGEIKISTSYLNSIRTIKI